MVIKKKTEPQLLLKFEIEYIFMKLKLYVNNDLTYWNKIWEPQWTASGLHGYMKDLSLYAHGRWVSALAPVDFRVNVLWIPRARVLHSSPCLIYIRCTQMTLSHWTFPTALRYLFSFARSCLISVLKVTDLYYASVTLYKCLNKPLFSDILSASIKD